MYLSLSLSLSLYIYIYIYIYIYALYTHTLAIYNEMMMMSCSRLLCWTSHKSQILKCQGQEVKQLITK